ncbi:MAG: T9SS type A sorting domain-containing protein [Flavobacteriales bacterium]|nr:T9SS type A sorting domain-containing protein [Flavobacteriales bacterium]
MLAAFSSIAFLSGSPEAKAQPGDVNRIDIRLVQSGATQLEVQLRPNNAWDYSDGVVNLTFAVRWETAAGGTLLGNSSQGFDECMLDGLRLLGNPGIVNFDFTNDFRYRGYNCTGGGWSVGDGCEYPANTWIPYARMNVTGLTGCGTFVIVASDDYTNQTEVNSNWFISLGGVNITSNSQVVGPGVQLGNCTPDCNGVIGGTASIDQCGVCSGGNTGVPPNSTCLDCNGTINGTASIDQCGVCSGGTTGVPPNSTCLDCNGTINGTASIDQCGVCSGGTTGVPPNSTCLDCNGTINGTASIDQCGVCSGGTTGVPPNSTCLDCNGTINGTASIDQCGVCSGGTTGVPPNSTCLDCNGDINGTAFIDGCGTCVGGNTGLSPCGNDCAGVPGGTASIDQCGVCSGGTTGVPPNSTCLDCNGDINGTASVDQCGVCSGGNTGVPPNSTCLDCNGDINGTASVDQCGVCSGGNTGVPPNSTCLDCNGDINGTAFIDGCGTCVGGNTGLTPCGTTCSQVNLEFDTDDNGLEIGWAIYPIGSATAVCSGQGLPSNASGVLQTCCLPDGCYRLEVIDLGNNGILNGGYVLRTAAGQRIIDNKDNGDFGGLSAISNGQGFCLPLGNDQVIYTSCDKYWWKTNEYIVADPNEAVSAVWVPGGANSVQSTNTGYEFWFFDPNGSYSFRKFRNHATSDGYGNVGATRACHLKINNWAAANHIPQFTLMNVRIRSRVNGVDSEWGPACRFVRNEALSQCPPTKLMDIPTNPNLSCDQFRQFVSNQRVHARPVSGANLYQWRFRIEAEGVEIIRTSTTYFLNLGWAAGVAAPLEDGKTYQVDVRASKNGGATWCGIDGDPWGDICSLTIGSNPGDGGTPNMLADGTAVQFNMWPNPNRGDELWLSMNVVPQGIETVSVDVHDLFGKRVMARIVPAQDGQLLTKLPISGDIAAGMYMVTVTAGDVQFIQRLVIQP